jgi:hypothetical protein
LFFVLSKAPVGKLPAGTGWQLWQPVLPRILKNRRSLFAASGASTFKDRITRFNAVTIQLA